MAYIKADRIKDTTTTTGTGAFALAGIVIPGSRPFNVVMLTINDTCEYSAGTNTGTEFETGLGTYSAANQLTRTTIYSSSNNGNAVNFSAGTKDVFMGPIASSVNDIAHGGTGATTAADARTNLGAGTVTSVAGTGTVSGLSLSGTVTSSGSLTLGGTLNAISLTTGVSGTLPIANGGTNAITAAAARTSLGLVIGTDVQAYDSDLTTWAGVTPATGVAAFLATPSSANLAAALTDETGTGANVFATSPTLVTPLSNTLSAVPVTANNAGNSLTISAGSGVGTIGTQAGGSLILQAGLQANGGLDGKVIVKQVSGQTSNLQEWQDSNGAAYVAVLQNGAITFPTASTSSNNVNDVIFKNTNGYLYVQGGSFGTIIGGNGGRNSQIILNTRFEVNLGAISRFVVTATGNVGIGINSTTINNLLSVTTPTTTDSLADVLIATTATTKKGVVIQGKAAQTANLQEWQNSAGTILASVSAAGVVKTIVLTVATLPAAATALAGARAFVSDATLTTFATEPIGGGSNGVPVYCDGDATTPKWRIG